MESIILTFVRIAAIIALRLGSNAYSKMPEFMPQEEGCKSEPSARDLSLRRLSIIFVLKGPANSLKQIWISAQFPNYLISSFQTK